MTPQSPFAAVRYVLLAAFSWCAGAMFAVTWAWLMGLQLNRYQAQVVIGIFALLGVVFGLVQVLRGKTDAQPLAPEPASASQPADAASPIDRP